MKKTYLKPLATTYIMSSRLDLLTSSPDPYREQGDPNDPNNPTDPAPGLSFIEEEDDEI